MIHTYGFINRWNAVNYSKTSKISIVPSATFIIIIKISRWPKVTTRYPHIWNRRENGLKDTYRYMYMLKSMSSVARVWNGLMGKEFSNATGNIIDWLFRSYVIVNDYWCMYVHVTGCSQPHQPLHDVTRIYRMGLQLLTDLMRIYQWLLQGKAWHTRWRNLKLSGWHQKRILGIPKLLRNSFYRCNIKTHTSVYTFPIHLYIFEVICKYM